MLKQIQVKECQKGEKEKKKVHFNSLKSSKCIQTVASEEMNSIISLQTWILTRVDSAVVVDGGQDTGKWIARFVLNLVTGQQFELL